MLQIWPRAKNLSFGKELDLLLSKHGPLICDCSDFVLGGKREKERGKKLKAQIRCLQKSKLVIEGLNCIPDEHLASTNLNHLQSENYRFLIVGFFSLMIECI